MGQQQPEQACDKEEVEGVCISLRVAVGDKERIELMYSLLYQAVGLQQWTEKGEIPASPGSQVPVGKESPIWTDSSPTVWWVVAYNGEPWSSREA